MKKLQILATKKKKKNKKERQEGKKDPPAPSKDISESFCLLQGIQKISLSMNSGGLSRRKLPLYLLVIIQQLTNMSAIYTKELLKSQTNTILISRMAKINVQESINNHNCS